MRTALIAVDDSEASLRAVRWFAGFARGVPAMQAVLMNVEPPLPFVDRLVGGSPAEERQFAAPLREKAERLLAAVSAEFDRARIPYTTAVEFGDPAERIVAAARRMSADLIVIAPGRRSALEKLLLGSVAQKVLQQAELPVLLVK
jgi:nucleotide-binding universal stress UspA family protein